MLTSLACLKIPYKPETKHWMPLCQPSATQLQLHHLYPQKGVLYPHKISRDRQSHCKSCSSPHIFHHWMLAASYPFKLSTFAIAQKFLISPRQRIGCLFVNLLLCSCSCTTCILKREYYILLRSQGTANLIAHRVQSLIDFIIGRLGLLHRHHISTH